MLVKCDEFRYYPAWQGQKYNKSTWKAISQSYSAVCGTPDFADVTQQSGTFHCKII